MTNDETKAAMQEMFNKVWQYFIVEKHSRSAERTQCFYRHPSGDGRRCAAGLFIKDEEYHTGLETLGVRSLPVSVALKKSGVPDSVRAHDLLRDLQWVHDTSHGELVDEEKLRLSATFYGLEVPA